MAYITYKKLNNAYNNATTTAEKNAIRKKRDVLHIATRGGDKKRVSEATYKKALKAYRLFKRLNRLNDRLLILDNDETRCNRRYTLRLHEDAEALELATNDALKPFKLKLHYCNWLASIIKDDGTHYNIGLNYVI